MKQAQVEVKLEEFLTIIASNPLPAFDCCLFWLLPKPSNCLKQKSNVRLFAIRLRICFLMLFYVFGEALAIMMACF